MRNYYISRKNPFLWTAAVILTASIAMRIIFPPAGNIWVGVIVPCAATVLLALIAIGSGDTMLFRSAVPVWILGVCFALRIGSWEGWLGGLAIALPYTIPFFGVPFMAFAWIGCLSTFVWAMALRAERAELLWILGLVALLAGTRAYADDDWHPSWGDRVDGRRVRTAPAMEQITAYFMPNRTGANNLFSASVEITELERYVREKRRQGLTGFGPSHVLMAAYARTVARYPALNRFIAGQRIYSRGADIALCMTVKKKMTADAPDSLIKVHLRPEDTAAEVYEKFTCQLERAKNEMENTNADNTADAFMMIPGLFLKFAIWLLKTMDYFGLVPRFLLEVSPFHGSVYFTSMGSLGIQPVYHHLYDFGTVPVFCSFGRKRRAQELCDGEMVERKYMDLKFNLDERICDGFYYASVIKYFLRLLSHPQVLDEAPEEVAEDIP